MNTKLNTKNVLAKGFSLVEMLVVIAVIGIIAAIAIPSIGSINASAQTATAKRNAQNLASVYQSGLADGVAWGATDVATARRRGPGRRNRHDGTYFAVKGLDAAAVTAATARASPGMPSAGLIYNPAGIP